MNKKSYQSPTTEVVKIQATSIICQSINRVNSAEGLRYGGAGSVDANSRGGGWDDDDE